MNYPSLNSFLVSFFVTIFFIPLVRRFALWVGVVDQPGKRRIHHQAIPRFGGLAIFFGLTSGLIFFWIFSSKVSFSPFLKAILIGVLGSVGLGLWDDFVNLKSKPKLFFQILLAGIVFYLGFQIKILSLGNGQEISLGVFSLPVTIFWIVGIMNAVNLIDGIDGLAAGVSSVAFGFIGFLSYQLGNLETLFFSLISLGACLGFLVFNFSPARIFMGDTGSLLLGFLLSVLSLSLTPEKDFSVPVFVPILLLAYPILDTTIAILRRSIRANSIETSKFKRRVSKVFKQVLSADGEHIHHRLLEKGWSQRKVSLLLYGFSALGCLIACSFLWLPNFLCWVVVLAAMFLMIQFVLSLEYDEFVIKEIRKQERPGSQPYIGEVPAIVRRVSNG